MKRGSIIASIGAVSIVDTREFVKDLVVSKLKGYGYSTMVVVLTGPYLQVISIPLYVIASTRKLRRIAIYVCELGAKITAGEMSIMNWGWIASDLILFGEPVPIIKHEQLMLLDGNETSVIDDIINSME